MKPIAVASDHAGFHMKSEVIDHLAAQGLPFADLGTGSQSSVDYPDFGRLLAEAIGRGESDRGILICGTGIGMAMAANRHPHIRAAVCHDVTSARLARLHNDANVLALGARLVGAAVALDCVDTFLAQDFEGGRHARRVDKLARLPQSSG